MELLDSPAPAAPRQAWICALAHSIEEIASLASLTTPLKQLSLEAWFQLETRVSSTDTVADFLVSY